MSRRETFPVGISVQGVSALAGILSNGTWSSAVILDIAIVYGRKPGTVYAASTSTCVFIIIIAKIITVNVVSWKDL